MASYTRFLTVTGKVGIPEHCVFGGVHRPRKRFAQVDLDISSATAGKDVSRALHARERLLQLSFSGIGHIRQRPLAVGDEDDWSGANRHRGLSRDRLPTEGIGSSEVEVYDVGRARNPPQAIGESRSGAAASANLLRSAL